MGFFSNKDEYLPEFVRTASGELLEQYLRDRERGWNLQGPAPDNSEHGSGDYFRVWRENGENRLMISTFTPTHAGISVHARFSNKMATAFADYLEEVGFIEPFNKSP
jgi:hypothetical protein